MIEKNPVIYSPLTLNEALGFLASNPDAQIYAGGTTAWCRNNLTSPLTMPLITLSIHLLSNVKRIVYNDRFLELGANVVLNQILCVDPLFVHPLLKEVVRNIGHSSLRNLATVGGNLCQRDSLGDLFPVLSLLEAQFETRGLRSGRWINALAFSHKTPFLQPGEILTRIRIPQEKWDYHFYQKIGHFHTSWSESLTMMALVRLNNLRLESLRFAFYIPHSGILRDNELEVQLAGHKLPLDVKVRQIALELIDKTIFRQPIPCSIFQRHRILHMTRWFLSRLEKG